MVRIKTSWTRPLAVEKGTVVAVTRMLPPTETDMPIEEQQKYPFTIITFTDEEYEEWISRLPEDVVRVYRDRDVNAIRSSEAIARAFFNPKPIVRADATPSNATATTSKRKRDSDGDDDEHSTATTTTTDSSSGSSSGRHTGTKARKRAKTHLTEHEREAIKWDRHDMPPDVSGHPPPVSRAAISGKVVEHVLRAWGDERRDYLNGAQPLAIEDLPVAHRASLAGRICLSVPTFGVVPYVYSYPAQYGGFEVFTKNRESRPYWEPADMRFEGALQNGRLCNCFCTHSTQGDQYGDFVDTADRHLLRTEINKPRSDADWIVCTVCGKASHRMCIFLNYRYKTTRDPVQPGWICDRNCTASLTSPAEIQGDATIVQATWKPSGTLLGMPARTMGPPRRVRKTIRGARSNTGHPELSSSDPLLSLSDRELDARMTNYMAAATGTDTTAAPLNA